MNEFDKEKISVNNAFEFHAVNIAEKVKGNFDFLGKKYPKDIAKKISSCLLHPVSLQEFRIKYKFSDPGLSLFSV